MDVISDGNNSKRIPDEVKSFGKRHQIAILLFLVLFVLIGQGASLSVGMVAMTDNSTNTDFKQMDWDETSIGLIFSMSSLGILLSSIPSSIVSQRYGPKLPLFIAMLCRSLLTMLISVIADWGWPFMVMQQFLVGLAGGFVYPCVAAVMGKWFHPLEREYLAPIVLIGSKIGMITMTSLSGAIAASSLGWPGIFYVAGGLGIVWCGLWMIFGSNSPAECSNIKIAERRFIESMPGNTSVKYAIPWSKILSSMAVWSIVISQCSEGWGFTMLLTYVPTFIKGVLKFDIKKNALMSSLPYLVTLVVILGISNLSNFLIKRNYLSISASRKLFNSIGTWIPAVCLIVEGFVTDDAIIAIIILTFAISINGATYSGFSINHIDISPNFAGAIVGMSYAVGNVFGFLSPLYVGLTVKDINSPELWRIPFCTTAGIYFISNLMFLIYGRATVQDWNEPVLTNSRKTRTDSL